MASSFQTRAMPEWQVRSIREHAEKKRGLPGAQGVSRWGTPGWFSWVERRVWSEDDATTRAPDHVGEGAAFECLYPEEPSYQESIRAAIDMHDVGDATIYLVRTKCGKFVSIVSSYPGNSCIEELEPPVSARVFDTIVDVDAEFSVVGSCLNVGQKVYRNSLRTGMDIDVSRSAGGPYAGMRLVVFFERDRSVGDVLPDGVEVPVDVLVASFGMGRRAEVRILPASTAHVVISSDSKEAT